MRSAAGSLPVTLRVPAPSFALPFSLFVSLLLCLRSSFSLASPSFASLLLAGHPSISPPTGVPPLVHKHASPFSPKPTLAQWPKPGLTGIICNSLMRSSHNCPSLPAGPSGSGSWSPGSLSAFPPVSALSSVPTFSLTPLASDLSAPSSSAATLPSLHTLLASVSPVGAALKPKPLAYSPVLPPIPAKAVEKIRAGAYIDLKELLVDNIALTERLQEFGQSLAIHAPQSTFKLRSIPDPLTWVFCFLGYMAAATDSPMTRDMAAYAQIVIQQSRKHPGRGWLAYDQLFRQQRAAGINIPWNDLASSIMAATVLRSGDCCSLCHSPDHTTEQCACALFADSRPNEKQASAQGQAGRSTRLKPYPQPLSASASSSEEACRRFNRGTCPNTGGNCAYAHTCLSCGSTTHGSARCPDRKEEHKGKGRPSISSSPGNKSS